MSDTVFTKRAPPDAHSLGAGNMRIARASDLVDVSQSAPFLDALFRYASPNSWIALRVFPHARGNPPVWMVDVRAGERAAVLEAVARGMRFAATTTDPAVFSPAMATFIRPGTARTRDLAEGVALIVEIDEGDSAAALARLEVLIGPATVVIRSGSEWTDPSTGEVFPKRHIYWRLSEPTRGEADHVLLYAIRCDATRLIGADPTGKSVVHCFRWPGSINRKNPGRPAICTIERLNPDAEIHLVEAAERLAQAVDGVGLGTRHRNGGAGINGVNYRGCGELVADNALVAAAMSAISNPDLHYDDWIRWGYAVCGSTGGAGYDIWRAWSAKSSKHDDGETEAAWRRIVAAGVNRIGAGSIFSEAKRCGWIDPRWTELHATTPVATNDGDATAQRLQQAERLWRESVPLPGTPGAVYLESIALSYLIGCAELRFHRACPHPTRTRLPALIAAVRDADGKFTAIYRTYLRGDGGPGLADVDPQRAALRPVWGGAIRLASLEDVLAADELVIGTDLEGVASLGLLLRPQRPAWAAVSDANLAAGVALPAGVGRVMIAADPDGPGRRAANAAWHRWTAEGRRVRISTPNHGRGDFNEILARRTARGGTP